MTAQKAIQFLKETIAGCTFTKDKQLKEVCEVSIEALEKQIPKKPTHEASLYKCLTCPNCKNVIDEFTEIIPKHLKVRVKTIHCKFCGQVLDWSDT